MTFDVLHLIASDVVGGPEKQILHHAEDMQDSEYRISIGSFHGQTDRPEILLAAEQRNVPTFCLPCGLRLDLVDRLSRELKLRRGALLCTHGFKATVVGYLAARRTGTRHVAFVRGFTKEMKRVVVYEMLERQALKRAQTVVCVSQKQADQIGPLRKKRSQPIVVKNAMLPPYSRNHGGPAPTRGQMGLTDETFVFGSVGRLSKEKGHRFMIAAFHQLCENAGPDARLSLLVIGDGAEREALEQQSSELGIRDKVIFAGFQGDCGAWMQLLDCMVHPSLTEGTPNAVLEALCLQVPVIATAVGGVPDLIVDGENGLLVPSEDVSALAQAMDRLRTSPELRTRVIAGAEEITREYSPAHQRQKLIGVYEQAFRT